MTERLSIEAQDDYVVFKIGDRSVTQTPREAQRTAFDLARAYITAGGLDRAPYNGVVRLPASAR
jgi:hypothetical protein